MRPTKVQVAVALAGALVALAADARATPQANAGLTIGGGASDLRAPPAHAFFHLGARADVLFLRTRSRDMGIGPYVLPAPAATPPASPTSLVEPANKKKNGASRAM